MKKIIALTGTFFLSFAGFAQVSKTDTTKKTAGRKVLESDIKNLPADTTVNEQPNMLRSAKWKGHPWRVCVVTIAGTARDCDITFENKITSANYPTDGASTQNKSPNAYLKLKGQRADCSVTQINSLQYGASGKTAERSSSAGDPIGGISARGRNQVGQMINIIAENGVFTLPTDWVDGQYNLTISWHWNSTQEASAQSCNASLTLTMEGGGCTEIAIN